MGGARVALVVCTAAVVGIQLVPYGRGHDNPPISGEPRWDSDRTRSLFDRACKNCHSNETVWPWYGLVAPTSWLVEWDVDEARSHFNVSEWGRKKNHGDESAAMVRDGEMPPWFYVLVNRDADLSDAERADLIAGLVATFGDEESGGQEEPGPAAGGDGHDH